MIYSQWELGNPVLAEEVSLFVLHLGILFVSFECVVFWLFMVEEAFSFFWFYGFYGWIRSYFNSF